MPRFLVSPQYNPYLNLAVENSLLDMPSDGEVSFFLWQNHRTVVIGQNQNPYAECDVSSLEGEGGCLMRRRTGGGAVYHDLGNLNFTYVAPAERYDAARQFSVIQQALAQFGLTAERSGRNDLTASGRKISGSAFSIGRTQRLHHGTLLLRTNVADLQRYLKPNPAKLQKHGVESVRSRVANIADLLAENGNPLGQAPTEQIVSATREALAAAFANEYGQPQLLDWNRMADLPAVRELYAQLTAPEWLYGRWREFRATKSRLFSWGFVEIGLSIDQAANTISEVAIASDSLCPEAIAQAESLLRNASTLTPPTIPLHIQPDSPNHEIIRDIFHLLY